ncbi:MAG: hypothetical protein V1797_08845 [Pseudomonadota bacterium]
MANIRKVYFPLRSNISVFEHEELSEEISLRIKQSILTYDQVIFENGTYVHDFWEDGSFGTYFPPGVIPESDRLISYERDIKNTKMKLAFYPETNGVADYNKGHCLLDGTTTRRYKIDFYHLLKNIEDEHLDFVKYITVDKSKFPREANKLIDVLNFHDRRGLTGSDSERLIAGEAIKNINYDLVTSTLLGSAISLDGIHSELIRKKPPRIEVDFSTTPSQESIVINRLSTLFIPNLHEIPLTQIIKMRKDRLWVDFRQFVAELSESIILGGNKEVVPENNYLEIDRHIIKALAKECEKHRGRMTLVLDICMQLVSFIPGCELISGLLGLGKSTISHLKNHSGWFAYISKFEKLGS